MKYKISVIVTTFERPKRLKKALQSIFDQTFKDFEVIVVDDCSKDKTPNVVRKFINKYGVDKIRYIRRKENFGQHTRPKNEGIQSARTSLIAFLDDDNTWRRDHLQALYKDIIANPTLDGVYGDRMLVDEGGRHGEKPGIRYDWNPALLGRLNYIDTSDVLVKKESMVKVGGWDETLLKFADWNLWLRMAKANMVFLRVPIILTDYHVHTGMNQLKTNTGVDQATGLINPSFDPTLCKVWATKTLFGEAKPLKVAIFTLTYNRLDYTKRMFSAVKKFTNYQYDHYVVDNGSTDGTVEYLGKKDLKVIYNKVNVGISKASNQALDAIGNNYDIIIKMDNDCEVESDKWLETIIDVYERSGQYIISPYVEGLVDSPGGVKRIRNGYIGRHTLGLTTHLGGLCIAAPYKVYQGFRWEEEDFLHSSQDYIFSQHCLKQRYALAYLENIRVMHMDTTVGQQEKYPEYFEKRMKEKTIRYEKK